MKITEIKKVEFNRLECKNNKKEFNNKNKDNQDALNFAKILEEEKRKLRENV